MPLERIYIHEARQLLAIKSTKAIEKWCNANGIRIYIEGGRKFMCRIEFLLAIEKPFIQSLKKVYGTKWKEVYRIMETNDSTELVDYLDINDKLPITISHHTSRYKPKSLAAKRLMQEIQKD